MNNQEKLEKVKNKRLEEINVNYQGCKMKIIKYNNANDIMVEFQDEYKAKIKSAYKEFKKGNIKNPYYPSVLNKGYFGQGKYKSRGEDGKQTKAYIKWKGMLERCYDEKRHKNHPTYADCYVCKEWLNFQNFAEWFYKHYYECNGEKMCLDKDILIKGNKVYSPETCIFVPNNINVLFTKREKDRGKYPIGIRYCERDNALIVGCSVNGKMKHLGYFKSNEIEKAFNCYKEFKEKYIKQIADEYKDLIPKELYEALYKYEVEIND